MEGDVISTAKRRETAQTDEIADVAHGQRGPKGRLSPLSASLNTRRRKKKKREHNQKFLNGEQDDCQHFFPAWRSS